MDEYKVIDQLFKNGGNKGKIKSIKKIYNKAILLKYENEKARLKTKNHKESEELLLFHGTRTTNPKLIYKGEDGFDPRFASKGSLMYGKAVYFSNDSQYSGNYAYCEEDRKGIFNLAKRIFLK